MVGVGTDIVNVSALDVALFSDTVTWAVPGVVIRLASTGAVSSVELTKLVASAEPFHCTTAPETKSLPFTVKVNAEPPAPAVLGLNDVMLKIVNVSAFEVAPPDLTVTCAVPGFATRFAGTEAVSLFALTNVVESAVLPQ
jgi:hypothetical protein